MNVELLCLNETALTSLVNLPDLAELKRIEVSGNNLTGNNLKHLNKYVNLHTVKFSDNKVSDYAELDPLKNTALANLSLDGNPIADKADYREKIFEIFPELEVLDGFDRQEN